MFICLLNIMKFFDILAIFPKFFMNFFSVSIAPFARSYARVAVKVSYNAVNQVGMAFADFLEHPVNFVRLPVIDKFEQTCFLADVAYSFPPPPLAPVRVFLQGLAFTHRYYSLVNLVSDESAEPVAGVPHPIVFQQTFL